LGTAKTIASPPLPRAVATFSNETYEEEPYDEAEGADLGRVHITRRFRGDLEGTGTAELLTATTAEGSAAYFALDRLHVSLEGRRGSFVLQHGGTVTAEGPDTWGSVLPSSGTGELRGLRGEAQISVDEDGRHRLTLDYEIDEQR
jgi:Protein of unknown function (DUF3224)